MELDLFDRSIKEIVDHQAEVLEGKLDADVLFYTGGIFPRYFSTFRDFIENIRSKSDRQNLAMFLRTQGGAAETAEQIVGVLRHHYRRVYFVVPDYAMSAGTILCMSGDRIYMDCPSRQQKGQQVTQQQREDRAEEVANQLADHRRWRSHGRNLNIRKLRDIGLKIDDYSKQPSLKDEIRRYNASLTRYVDRMDFGFFLHNRNLEL